MIVYDLQCGGGHRFEGWFASAEDFGSQRERKLLECPSCGAKDVVRVPSAARLNMGAMMPVAAEKAPAVPAEATEGRDPLAIAQILYSRMVDALLTKSEDVGKDFPAEARRIHNDEAPKRAIRGQASDEEHEALVEDGIPVIRLPVPPEGHWN
ncbi:MAG: hypothetical protein AMJ64_08350 [Betaproteobacteria bacterium SG8_39]|nr:MAG: hypothetical protein AMJ64_08350 [Betaproteobacteria bacterium SG8_39]